MDNKAKIKDIVDSLNQLDLDAETMEDILEQVGMREQVVNQVLDSEKYIVAKKVWDDIFNNDTLTFSSFEEYYNNTFINQ